MREKRLNLLPEGGPVRGRGQPRGGRPRGGQPRVGSQHQRGQDHGQLPGQENPQDHPHLTGGNLAPLNHSAASQQRQPHVPQPGGGGGQHQSPVEEPEENYQEDNRMLNYQEEFPLTSYHTNKRKQA